METISGANNWNLTVRRDADGVTLLRCHTPDERAVVPETVGGLPVTALGRRALCPDARETEGETVRITCAPSTDGSSLSFPQPESMDAAITPTNNKQTML